MHARTSCERCVVNVKLVLNLCIKHGVCVCECADVRCSGKCLELMRFCVGVQYDNYSGAAHIAPVGDDKILVTNENLSLFNNIMK